MGRRRAVFALLGILASFGTQVEKASSHVHARSTLVLLDGTHVTPSEAFSVSLVKGVVDSKRRAELLIQLKFMQLGLEADSEMLAENRRAGVHMRRHRSSHHRVLAAADANMDEEGEEEDLEEARSSHHRSHFRASGHRALHRSHRSAHHRSHAAATEGDEEEGEVVDEHRDARMRFASAEAMAGAEAGAESSGHHAGHKGAHAAQQRSHAASGASSGSTNAAGAVVHIEQKADAIGGLGGALVASANGGAASVSLGNTGVDIDNEPLQAQILSQKRLATYYGEVHIGGQPFKVLFDTGSCEFWVPAHNCEEHTKPSSRCAKHSKYTPAKSQKFHRFAQHPKMLIQYLSGKVEGPLGVDDVVLGSLTVPNQIFGIAETIDVPLLDEVRWDGIMGLAYPSSTLSRKGVRPVFDNVMDQKLLKEAIFGYYLGPRGGVVTFGAVDRQWVQRGSEFVFASVTHQGYWTIGIKDIVLKYPGTGEVSTGVCKDRPHGMCKAIVDTGTYLVYGPASDVKGALRDIQASTCDRVAGLPSITFILHNKDAPGGVNVTLAPHDYTLDFRVPVGGVPADECSQAQYDHPDGQGIDSNRCARDCVTGIAPDADTLWTLGQVFLRNYYAVFDRAKNRIGFARAAAAGSI